MLVGERCVRGQNKFNWNHQTYNISSGSLFHPPNKTIHIHNLPKRKHTHLFLYTTMHRLAVTRTDVMTSSFKQCTSTYDSSEKLVARDDDELFKPNMFCDNITWSRGTCSTEEGHMYKTMHTKMKISHAVITVSKELCKSGGGQQARRKKWEITPQNGQTLLQSARNCASLGVDSR